MIVYVMMDSSSMTHRTPVKVGNVYILKFVSQFFQLYVTKDFRLSFPEKVEFSFFQIWTNARQEGRKKAYALTKTRFASIIWDLTRVTAEKDSQTQKTPQKRFAKV